MVNFSNITTIYVSQNSGHFLNTGFAPVNDELGNGPLENLEQAFAKVYQMRCSGVFRPVTIQITDDEYYLDKTIELDTSKMLGKYRDHECICGITVEPYKERCKIIGGKRLFGFKEDEFNGVRCFSLYIPEVKAGEWEFTDLYVNGERASLTRYPENGTLRCVDTENNVGELFAHSEWFIAKKEDLACIKDVESAIVSYYHYWVDEHSPVKSYDKETGKLTMEYKSRFNITNRYDKEDWGASNLEYYLENIAEAFKNPGEWYLQKAEGMLYYIPKDDKQEADNIIVYAPLTDKILTLRGSGEQKVKNIYFRDFDFVCSAGDYASTAKDPGLNPEEPGEYASDSQSVSNAYGAVNFENAKNCGLESCNFTNLGTHAVAIEKGCSDIEILGCNFSNIGAGGIKIAGGEWGCESWEETHHIKVQNCIIKNCGRRYAAGCGILAMHAHNCEFSDNEISYLDYSGISVGWIWGYRNSNTYDDKVLRNHIHHIGMGNLSDMGGIYLLGRQKGTLVSENVIHDCIGSHYGGWGIYTDEGSSYIRVEKNIVYNVSSECYHHHYGSDNVVVNNIFAFGKRGIICCTADELHADIIVEKNILVTNERPIFTTIHTVKGYNPALMSHHNFVYDISGREPVMFCIQDRNFTFSEVQQMGMEYGSMIINPGLTEKFNIMEDSELIKYGFKVIRDLEN